MKRAVIAAAVLLLVIATCITAFAFPRISTDTDNQEWKKGESISLIDNNKSGNDITTADVDCVFDNKTNEVYYRFSITTKSQAQDCSNFRISIQLDGISEIVSLGAEDFGVKGETDKSNPDYHIEYILYSGNSSNFFCKLKVRYNNGMGPKTSGSVQIWDKSNVASNKLDFDFENSDYTTTDIDSDANTSRTAKETTTKRRVRDRESSSKTPISTSRVVTTERATTAKKATTTRKVTTEKAATVKTTKAKTTKAGTTKAKHAIGKAAEADEVSVSVVTSIVYVVPETIISGTVYVTDETEQGNEKSAFDIKNMQKSTVMKIAAGGAALLLFGAIGIAAVKNKKDNGKDDTGTE